ncbi:MAG: hypothetical protein E6049_09300, partial [Varibaculum cambriense]|nr:hypothetical protein [Varibaculum cambriense]
LRAVSSVLALIFLYIGEYFPKVALLALLALLIILPQVKPVLTKNPKWHFWHSDWHFWHF